MEVSQLEIDVPSHTHILPIRVWAAYSYAYGQYLLTHAYAYELPVCVWDYGLLTGITGYPCFAHMRISAFMRTSIAAHM